MPRTPLSKMPLSLVLVGVVIGLLATSLLFTTLELVAVTVSQAVEGPEESPTSPAGPGYVEGGNHRDEPASPTTLVGGAGSPSSRVPAGSNALAEEAFAAAERISAKAIESLERVSAELVKVRAEKKALEKRAAWLETELQLCGSEVTTGPMGRWLASLQPEERPATPTLRVMADVLRPYPVELTAADGLWVAERIEAKDWLEWGESADEAIIAFLGPNRIAAEVPPDALERLRQEWAAEGLFD